MTKEELLTYGVRHQFQFTAPFVARGCVQEPDWLETIVRQRATEIARRELAQVKRRFLRSRCFDQSTKALIIERKPYV